MEADNTLKLIEAQRRGVDELDGVSVPPDATPLEFLKAVYQSATQPMSRRMRAAIEAAPYFHPKLSATATITVEDFASRLERAIMRSGKLIEHQPEEGQ
jgi:hypothetical protein